MKAKQQQLGLTCVQDNFWTEVVYSEDFWGKIDEIDWAAFDAFFDEIEEEE